MQLIKIDKARYRKHLNIVIVGFIAALLVMALIFGQLLIAGFEEEGISNFRYNLFGVVLALLACAAVLHSVKYSDFFKEIYYVWQVKQIQNLIYRRLNKIKTAVSNDDNNALITLLFYYQSLKQVYQLDDNILTLSTVDKNLNDIQETISNKSVNIRVEQFDKKLLDSYS